MVVNIKVLIVMGSWTKEQTGTFAKSKNLDL